MTLLFEDVVPSNTFIALYYHIVESTLSHFDLIPVNYYHIGRKHNELKS